MECLQQLMASQYNQGTRIVIGSLLLCGIGYGLLWSLGAIPQAPVATAAPLLVAEKQAAPVVQEVRKKELQYNSSETRHYFAGQPFTGVTTDTHKNGQLRLRWEMQEGKLHGKVEEYTEKGVLVTYKEYKNGLRHGQTRYYYPEGQLMRVVMYANDAAEGDETHYGRDGTATVRPHQP
jgi:antitoxin component YwqK of YwqJK toxin-antitoxin module